MRIKVTKNLEIDTDDYLSKLKDLDEKTRLYIFIGILIVVLILDFMFIMGPQMGALQRISLDIKQMKQDLQKTNTDISSLNEYKNEVVGLKEKIALSHNKVRSREEIPVVLERISYLANESGIVIDQIMPNAEDQFMLLEEDNKKYYSLPITMELRSDYHGFGKFLNKVELDDIYLKVGTFKISSLDESKKNVINLTLDAVVYETSTGAV